MQLRWALLCDLPASTSLEAGTTGLVPPCLAPAFSFFEIVVLLCSPDWLKFLLFLPQPFKDWDLRNITLCLAMTLPSIMATFLFSQIATTMEKTNILASSTLSCAAGSDSWNLYNNHQNWPLLALFYSVDHWVSERFSKTHDSEWLSELGGRICQTQRVTSIPHCCLFFFCSAKTLKTLC